MNEEWQKQRREFIEGLVIQYSRKFPEEYRIHCASCGQERRGILNKFGADPEGNVRKQFSIPRKLWKLLDGYVNDPKIFDAQGELKWFREKFPEFTIAEKY